MIDEPDADDDIDSTLVDLSSMPTWSDQQTRSFLHELEDFTILDTGLNLAYFELVCDNAPLGYSPDVADGLLLFIGRLMEEYPDVHFNYLIRKILDKIHDAARCPRQIV